MAIRIITDSSADFDSAVARRRNIDVVPMSIQFGDASFLAGRTLSNEVFYKLLQEKKENPTTSQPTPEAFLRLFQQAREAGDQVVAVVLSGALSGTLQSAVIAKELCQYEPIYLVDSRSASAGTVVKGYKTFSDVPNGAWYYWDIVEASNGHSFSMNGSTEQWTAIG